MIDKLLSVFIAGYLLGYILDGIYSVMNPPDDASSNDRMHNCISLLTFVVLFVLFILVIMGAI